MLANPGDVANFWVVAAVIVLVGFIKACVDSRKR